MLNCGVHYIMLAFLYHDKIYYTICVLYNSGMHTQTVSLNVHCSIRQDFNLDE